MDALAAKLSADGRTLEWCTFLGGSGVDIATGVALGAHGNVFVAGYTESADFEAVGGFDRTPAGIADGFVLEIGDRRPPVAPSELRAVAGSRSGVRLIWKDNSADEDGFVVERASVRGGGAGPCRDRRPGRPGCRPPG